jgi:D-alanyl-lipoteichoic acid acyltransferase DltB (MBOAT superfamily)
MVFSSFVFLFLFLPAALLGYYLLRGRSLRNIFLLACSMLFYAWGEPIYILVMIASFVGNWALALRIPDHPRKRLVLTIGITLNLLMLAVFKYAGFIARNVSGLTGLELPEPRIALPIGISFYTFQAVSYLVDVYRGEVKPQRNPIYYGMYLSMFAQLIAGPIVRYETVAGEIDNRRENISDFLAGLRRFVIGLGKKVLIANTMGEVADHILEAGPNVGLLPAWVGFVAYSFQIYYDFSGYSDMAIGLGRMFGFHFLENFNYPFIAESVGDFRRRWHVSLTSFFRDYVYIPLGGNRVGKVRWTFNLLVVWSLTGLWHGAAWNFVLWGTYYGVLMILERFLWGDLVKQMPRVLRCTYSNVAFVFGCVFFRVEDAAAIWGWFAALVGVYGPGDLETLSLLNVLHRYPWFIIAAVGSTPLLRTWLTRFETSWRTAWMVEAYLVLVLLASTLYLVQGGFNPFIYFRF